MASSLLSLPAGLIDRILSYDDVSYLSLPLWLVGNTRLHKVLSDSVTFVELRNPEVLAYLRLPKYLTQLRSLRHLLVDRVSYLSYGKLYDPMRTFEVISGLPETMESLILRFDASKDFFFPASPAKTSHLTLATAFPGLRLLQLDFFQRWTPDEVKELPRSLTSLDFGVVSSEIDYVLQTLDCLPREIESLTIYVEFGDAFLLPSFFEHLPPHTREVNAIGFLPLMPEGTNPLDARHLAAMPRSLTGISIGSDYDGLTSGRRSVESFRNINSMANYSLRWTSECGSLAPIYLLYVETGPIPKKDRIKALEALPKNLQTFNCYDFNFESKHFRALPRGLKHVYCRIRSESSFKRTDFPPELTMMTMRWKDSNQLSFLSVLSVLPPLTHFRFHSKLPMKNVSLLPRTLTWLEANFTNVNENIEFPPKLTYLKFWGRITDFEPPRFEEEPALTTSGKKQKSEKKAKAASSSGITPTEGSTVLRTFPVWLLPWSLTELWALDGDFPATSLPRLPPHLRSLTVGSVFLDSSFDPSDPKMISMARSLAKEAGADDGHDFLLEDPRRPRVTLYDLLPRSLTVFAAKMPMMSAVSHSRLPPNLKEFQIYSAAPGQDPDALFYIPKARLKKLDFSASTIDSSHLKAVQHIPYLKLSGPRGAHSLTLESIINLRCWNPIDNNWLSHTSFDLWAGWRTFVTEALEATQDPSGEALKAYLADKRKED